MITSRWTALTLAVVLVSACGGTAPAADGTDAVHSDAPVIAAIRLAYREARNDGVDLSRYDVSTVRHMGNGVNSFSQAARSTGHPLLDRLEGLRYWEVCFGKTAFETGRTYCYYVDRDSGRLILRHVE